MSTAEATQQPLSGVIPTPANFPIPWEPLDDAQHFWFRDQLHLPEPITPLDEAFARHVYRGMNVIFERYEIPLRVRSRRFNTYFYWQVRRRARAWTPAVHALLRHLEQVGFGGAPRIGDRRARTQDPVLHARPARPSARSG